MKLLRPLAFLAGSATLASLPFACTSDPLPDHGIGPADAGPEACVAKGAPCAVTFTYPFKNEHAVELRGDFAPGAWVKGVPMALDGEQWKATLDIPGDTVVHYKFFVDGMTWVTDPGNPAMSPDGNSVTTTTCNLPVCATPPPPDTGNPDQNPPAGVYDWRGAVLYFVFVDRFANGDKTNDAPLANVEPQANYQGGDYAGLLAKIEAGYFDGLGVDALWLTVPMDNAEVSGIGSDNHQYSAYHGYWVKRAESVEEHFGDLALLKRVVDAAHKRKIRVLFDYAMNHVHETAPIYKQHADWFWPLDYNGKYCVCGQGCDWNDGYEQKRCWFAPYLPDWDFQIPEARSYSVSNAIQWIKDTGIDGFRLDAVKHIERVWITDLRTRVTNEIESASKQHFYMVGETFESSNRDLINSYVDPLNQLDGQFDFPLRAHLAEQLLRRTGTMHDLDGFLATNDTYYQGVMSTFIGNHDLLRSIQVAADQPWDAWANGGDSRWNNPPTLPATRSPFERMAVAYTFLFTTKGIPLVYYGDEIGMPGAGDPDNRRFMQWDGYSPDQLFLRGTIAKLGKIRHAHPATWKGTRVTVSVTDDTYGYQMSDGTDTVYVALNRGDQPGGVAGMPAKGHDLLSDTDVAGPSVGLPPRSAMVIVPR